MQDDCDPLIDCGGDCDRLTVIRASTGHSH
jgi:hypothetical protein